MKERKETVGSLKLKAEKDTTKYNAKEVAHAVHETLPEAIQECINIHNKIFDEDEYCVCFVLADDPLIKGIRRRKVFALLHLPSPRPEQTVFLYNKRKDALIKRLWSLPDAFKMAVLSESPHVEDEWKLMKIWSDAFFNGTFWHTIRKMNNIDMLSEHEYLNAHREELIKSGAKECDTLVPEPFDFSKVQINKIIDPQIALSD